MNMSNFTFKKLLCIIALVFTSTIMTAQNAANGEPQKVDFKSYMYVTGDLGGAALSGDVNKIKLGFDGRLGLGLQFDKYFGLKANIGYGTLKGEMKDMFSVKNSNYVEGDINLTVSLIDLIAGYKADRLVTLTPHIGIGQLQYMTKIEKANGQTATIGYNNRDDNNIIGNGFGKRVITATVPIGLELGFNVSPKWNIYIDYTAKFLDSDRIDAYPGGTHNDWVSNLNIGARYSIRKNADTEDTEYCNFWYFTVDGGATLLFGDNKAWKGRDIKGNANIGVGYAFHNFMTVFGKIGYGMYGGEKKDLLAVRQANYITTTLNFGVDLMNAFNYKEDRKFGLVPHIGIGAVQYRGTTIKGNKTIEYGYDNGTSLKGDGFKGRRVVAEIPMGIELTYKMSKRTDLFLDGTVSYCNTDLIEGVASGKHDDWLVKANAGVRFKLNTSCDRKAKIDELLERITPQIIQCTCQNQKMTDTACAQPSADNTTDTVFVSVPVKEYDIIETSTHQSYTDLRFPLGRSEKDNTQSNKDAIYRATSDLNDGFTITSIIIEGYASPDGPEKLNQRLSEERAQAAKDFIVDQLDGKVGDAEITVIGKGGDWESLYEAIYGSGINDSDAIVEQLKNASNKNAELKKLVRKHPRIKGLFPQLRRASVTINTEKK